MVHLNFLEHNLDKVGELEQTLARVWLRPWKKWLDIRTIVSCCLSKLIDIILWCIAVRDLKNCKDIWQVSLRVGTDFSYLESNTWTQVGVSL